QCAELFEIRLLRRSRRPPAATAARYRDRPRPVAVARRARSPARTPALAAGHALHRGFPAGPAPAAGFGVRARPRDLPELSGGRQPVAAGWGRYNPRP